MKELQFNAREAGQMLITHLVQVGVLSPDIKYVFSLNTRHDVEAAEDKFVFIFSEAPPVANDQE